MKVSFVAAAVTLAATVAAQSLADLPQCAFSCLAGGLQKTGCGTDIGCACKKDDFVSSAVACVTSKCNAEDTATATKVALGICKAAGVDITLPGATTTASTTSAPTSTSTASTSTTVSTTTSASTVTSTPVKTSTSTTSTSTSAPTLLPITNGTNGTVPTTPPTNEDSAAGKLAVSGLLAAGLGLAVAFGL